MTSAIKHAGINVPALLQDAALRNTEFPITARKVFLAHAASSPLPRRVAAAMADYAMLASAEGQWEYIFSAVERETRQYAARLLGGSENEIAFVSSTSMGLSIVAAGYSWQGGENIIIADGDFPSNVYPWLNLQGRGAEVRFLPRHRDGSITVEDVMRLVDGKTRMVSLSSVNFVSGYRVDLGSIGKALAERGILFCVDGVQSLGAFPMDISRVDFVASSAHKWLLGPLGIGILYIKSRNLSRLEPVLAGWKCVQAPKDYLKYNLSFLDSARRFEPGGLNVTGIFGLHAALKLLLEAGIERTAARLGGFRRILLESLEKKGYEIITPLDPACGSGIVSFSRRKGDIAPLREELDRDGFVVSLRERLDGGKCIRVAPHFYNTEEEISRFVDRVPRVA